MPSDLTEQTVLSDLTRHGFPPFTLNVKAVEQPIQGQRRYRPDAELELEWDGRSRRFVVECKASATPKQVDLALMQLREYTREYGEASGKNGQQNLPKRFPMLVAPYLSPATLDRLAREGMSGIDLSGNGVVTVPGEWLVMRAGNENQYPSSAPIKNIYRGRSSLVCRALLLRSEYPSVGAVVQVLRSDSGGDTGVTQATVSKVLKTLEEELLVTRVVTRSGGKRGTSIYLAQPGELLDRLVRNYEAPKPTHVLRGALAQESDATPVAVIAAAAERADVRYAVDLVASYAPFPGAEEIPIYVESVAPILDSGVFRENDRFATLRLIETADATAYFDTRVIGGTSRVSPIQVYLELANGTKREREISDMIRARIVNEASIVASGKATSRMTT